MNGRRSGRYGTRPRLRIRAGAEPEAVWPRGAAPPTAERSESGGELRRVVYGGVESLRHESDGLLDGRPPLGRRKEARCPRKKNGKIKQDTNEGVLVVADLQRLDTEGALQRSAGDGGHALHKPTRQHSHPK